MPYTETIAKRGNWRVIIERDTDAINPRREYEHSGSVVFVPGSSYLAPDSDGGPLSHGWNHYHKRHGSGGVALFERWARIYHGAATLHDTPQEGAAAVWYLTAGQAAEHGITEPMALLESERDEYRAWADGDVWGISVQYLPGLEGDGNSDGEWEHVASCWGYIGYDYAVKEAVTLLEEEMAASGPEHAVKEAA